MIHEDILRRNAVIDCILTHDANFVVAFLPMISAHEELRGISLLIEIDRCLEPVAHKRSGSIVFPYPASENDDAVAVFLRPRYLVLTVDK